MAFTDTEATAGPAVQRPAQKQPGLLLHPQRLHLKHSPPEFFMRVHTQSLAVLKRIKCIEMLDLAY